MTTRTYTTGVIVSAALAITGVLWHQSRHPYVSGEDIASVLADALELRQIPVVQTAFTATNIIPNYTFSESRYYYGNEFFYEGYWHYGEWRWQEVIQKTSFTVTAFRAEESIRDATIRLIEGIGGTKAVGVYDPLYSVGPRNFLDPRCPSPGALDLSISPRWGTNALYRFDLAFEGYAISNIVFTANLLDLDCAGVTLRDRIVTGTNQYGCTPGGTTATSTPLTAGSIFGGAQNYAAFTNRLAGAESWWTYAGISPVSYLLEPVEQLLPGAPQAVNLSWTWIDRDSYDAGLSPYKWWAHYDPFWIGYLAPHVRRSPFITRDGLDAFRRVLTNMVRTVEFNPVCQAVTTTYSYSGTNAMTTSTNTSVASPATLPTTFFDYGVMTGLLTTVAAGRTNDYPINNFSTYWQDIAFTPMSIASNYYASGQVSRVRFYIATEASTPWYWYPPIYTVGTSSYLKYTNLLDYVGASLAANQTETYGYPVTHGAIPDVMLPASPGDNPRSWLLRDYVGRFTTNQVWNLLGDSINPISPPTFTLSASSLDKADLLPPDQMVDAQGTPPERLTAFWRYHSMRLSKVMMVVDWNITLKSSGGYTNAP